MCVAENIEKIKQEIGEGVKLVAVTKIQPLDKVKAAYQAGHKIFGENKVQELTQKQAGLPNDIEWHMIGHLQTNKVKYIAPFVSLVHSIDRMKLLRTVNKEARKHKRVIPCLLQFHIAEEETKFGLSLEEAAEMLLSKDYQEMENIRIVGVMGMATFTGDEEKVRREFRHLREIYNKLKERFFSEQDDFRELSMGMTNDYPVALEEGSTLLRIGTAIFGERNTQSM